jgi:hypothetical protein
MVINKVDIANVAICESERDPLNAGDIDRPFAFPVTFEWV